MNFFIIKINLSAKKTNRLIYKNSIILFVPLIPERTTYFTLIVTSVAFNQELEN